VHVKSAGYLMKPELKAKPYVGMSPKVLLIGQDPTLINRQVETVFELDRPNSRLRKYVEQEILVPLGFTVDDVYATNAVKCTFSGRTPGQWARARHVPTENILYPFFKQCKRYLTAELMCLRPGIVIAFGQPTHRLLVSAYKWKVGPNMKDVFGQVFAVHKPISTTYIPIIHYNSRRHRYYQEHWPTFLQEIREHIEGRKDNFQEKVGTTWLRQSPKKADSINAALSEIADAVRALKAKREHILLMNEKVYDYPREGRLKGYREQILCLEKVLGDLDDAMAELGRYLSKV